MILQQKSETIADFRKSDRFEMSNYTEALLRSLKRNGVEYSDVLVRGPETETVCRLVLDAFSASLYSSSPDVFAKIEDHVTAGYPMAQAIEMVERAVALGGTAGAHRLLAEMRLLSPFPEMRSPVDALANAQACPAASFGLKSAPQESLPASAPTCGW